MATYNLMVFLPILDEGALEAGINIACSICLIEETIEFFMMRLPKLQ